eukprot:752784-Hanusia_phi.AAC.1
MTRTVSATTEEQNFVTQQMLPYHPNPLRCIRRRGRITPGPGIPESPAAPLLLKPTPDPNEFQGNSTVSNQGPGQGSDRRAAP